MELVRIFVGVFLFSPISILTVVTISYCSVHCGEGEHRDLNGRLLSSVCCSIRDFQYPYYHTSLNSPSIFSLRPAIIKSRQPRLHLNSPEATSTLTKSVFNQGHRETPA
jgi:hypothetical protein